MGGFDRGAIDDPAAGRLFAKHGITLFDKEDLTTHELDSVRQILEREKAFGHFDLAYYDRFSKCVKESFLLGSPIPIFDPSMIEIRRPDLPVHPSLVPEGRGDEADSAYP